MYLSKGTRHIMGVLDRPGINVVVHVILLIAIIVLAFVGVFNHPDSAVWKWSLFALSTIGVIVMYLWNFRKRLGLWRWGLILSLITLIVAGYLIAQTSTDTVKIGAGLTLAVVLTWWLLWLGYAFGYFGADRNIMAVAFAGAGLAFAAGSINAPKIELVRKICRVLAGYVEKSNGDEKWKNDWKFKLKLMYNTGIEWYKEDAGPVKNKYAPEQYNKILNDMRRLMVDKNFLAGEGNEQLKKAFSLMAYSVTNLGDLYDFISADSVPAKLAIAKKLTPGPLEETNTRPDIEVEMEGLNKKIPKLKLWNNIDYEPVKWKSIMESGPIYYNFSDKTDIPVFFYKFFIKPGSTQAYTYRFSADGETTTPLGSMSLITENAYSLLLAPEEPGEGTATNIIKETKIRLYEKFAEQGQQPGLRGDDTQIIIYLDADNAVNAGKHIFTELQKTLKSTTAETELQTIQIELATRVKAAYDAFTTARLALDAAMVQLKAAAAATTAGAATGTVDAALTTFVGTYASKTAITDQITALRTQYTELDELINLNSSTTASTTAVTIDAGLQTILENTDTLDDPAIVEFAKLYYQMDATLTAVTTNTLEAFNTAVNTSLGLAATATAIDASNISNITPYFKDDADVGLLTSITDAHKATLDVLSKLVQVKSTAAGTTTTLNFPDELTINAATTYKPAKELLTNLEKVMAASTAAASTAAASTAVAPTAAASTVVKKDKFEMAYLTLKFDVTPNTITITPKEDTNFTKFIAATKKIPILLFDPTRDKAARQADIDKLKAAIGDEIEIQLDGYPKLKLSALREKVLGVK